MNPSPEFLLQVAMGAAEKAAAFVAKESTQVRHVDFKGAIDLVTHADRGSERIILDEISSHFPGHNILTEESPGRKGDSPYTWIIDPLDGTTNFVHGYPIYAVSVAVHKEKTPVAGVVVDVFHKQTYSATRDGGAFRDGKAISVSNTTKLRHSLLATGFQYEHDHVWARNFDYFKAFTGITQGVRRAGAASIDLVHVACGWLDGFWEFELHAWDTAAGMIVLKEAGGRVTRTDGRDFSILDKEIVASNGKIHDQMLALLNKNFL